MAYRKLSASRAEIVEALRCSYGLISAAGRRLGVSPKTLNRWLKNDPTILNQATTDERQDENLKVMQALFERAMAGDVKALISLAKLRGIGSGPRAILPRPLTDEEVQEHRARRAQRYHVRRRY